MEKVTIIELEQGDIGSSGNTTSNSRIRTAEYIRQNPLKSLKISATSSTGKALQIELYGYSDNITTKPIFDKYWYNVPYEFDLSPYINLRFIRIVVKYSDSSAITPEEISEFTVTEYFDWYADSTGIHCENMPESPEKAIYIPFPHALWRISGDVPTHKVYPQIPEKPIAKPYPFALWRIDTRVSELPYHELFPIEIPAGAFMGVKSLEYVRIPETVRKIGRYAFADTALKKVRISPDCEYYETSFPKNCIIEFYGNLYDKYSEQLYDFTGSILIDIDGARIYVKE
ncbi:MAG: leucine-rich repeat domain-containing protein [Ruminococcus sp.]|nr:leucine-rich repeat domain-containing protein [Ruminococcus sp.]